MRILILSIVLLSSCKKVYVCCGQQQPKYLLEALNKFEAKKQCDEISSPSNKYKLCE